jgi:hypothetical protein
MIKTIAAISRCCGIGLGVLALLTVAPARAQDDQAPAWLDVAILQVKGGKGPEFESLLKEMMAAQREAGQPVGQVFSVVAGHPNEYHIVTPIQALARNDDPQAVMPPGAQAVWFMRITETVDSARFFYARTYPQHGLAGNANAAPPTLLFLRTVHVAAGRGGDYEAWVENQLMPAMRQTDLLGHTLSRGMFGDSPQNFYHAIPVANWAALDGPDPVLEALGERRYQEMLDGLDGIVESNSFVLARIRSDLTGAD